jgi:hypothetical protein
VRETQEWLRLRANAAGANIGKLEDRGFATHHDSRKVAEAGFDAWWAAERPRWDLQRMVDERPASPSPGELLEAARAVHATIASDGALDRSPGGAGRLSFANRSGSTASSITRATTTGRRARRSSAPAPHSTRCSAK